MIILGISHLTDPAAGVIVDGELKAFAEEERFSRLKNSHGMFPGRSVKFCLQEADISLDQVDAIAVPYDGNFYPLPFLFAMARKNLARGLRGARAGGFLKNVRNLTKIALKNSPISIRQDITEGLLAHGIRGRVPRIEFVDHHLSHAITAGHFSGFEKALSLVIDGSGEMNATTLWEYDKGDLRLLDKYEIPDSLGWFYAGMTEYLGFEPYKDEGKTMGLAPYGNPDAEILGKISQVLRNTNGRYSIAQEYLLQGSHTQGLHFSDLLVELLGEHRLPPAPLTQRHKDIAWATQHLLEEAVKSIVNKAVEKYGMANICLAGGVALNCKMNGHVLYETKAQEIFVFPSANDSGSCIGAALHVSGEQAKKKRFKLIHTYYGSSFTADEIHKTLESCKVPFSRPPSIAKAVAELLAKGSLVGWFQGKMEFGPRALGNRSILANPLLPQVRDLVNHNVKFRESWRPFCPSVLNEQRTRYLKKDAEAPFMIVAHFLKDEWIHPLCAIAHRDGSVRPQTVTREQNPLYHELLQEFAALTGHGILLNTSLNVKEEPIVCRPIEAVRCLYGSGLDAMAIGPFLLTKPAKPLG